MWQPGWERVFGGEWIRVYVWLNPPYCPPETTTASLTGSTPTQNKQFKVEKTI